MDDEGGDVCRVCHGPSEPDEPLYYPCKCSGSIKFVHQVTNTLLRFSMIRTRQNLIPPVSRLPSPSLSLFLKIGMPRGVAAG